LLLLGGAWEKTPAAAAGQHDLLLLLGGAVVLQHTGRAEVRRCGGEEGGEAGRRQR
jgi:hypothetical protein